MKTNYYLLLLMLPMLWLGACKKGDQGSNGPKGDTGTTGQNGTNGKDGANGTNGTNGKDGAAGPTGANGANGAAGAKGATGATGTANVIYSDWKYAVNFRDTIADNSAMKAGDLLAPELTTDVLNNGAFMIYFTFGGGTYTLPYTSYAGSKLNIMSSLPRLKHFIITRFTADNSNSVALSTLLQYRYIIIPGGAKAAAALAQHVDINNYEAVKAYYHIVN